VSRIETIYSAINKMARAHGTPRPDKFGGGTWDFDEEIEIWKRQIIGNEEKLGYVPLTSLQWSIIDSYIGVRRNEFHKST